MADRQTVPSNGMQYEQEIARLHAKIARLEDKLAKTTTAKAEIAAEKVKARTARQEARSLQKQNEDLRALNRTKDEFIALTSHQLRTPATGTKQYLGMLLDGYAEPLGPRQRSYLQSAYDCNERQLRVVDDILRVAQVDLDKVILRKQATNLGQFLRQLLDEQSNKFERRDHVVNFQQAATTITADIDRDRLRMALDNIVDNADKYTEPGKRIELRLKDEGSVAVIEIEDEGVGIARRDFSKLFQKFSRIDNPLSIEVGGSGLGLYWAKRIIDMHGGSIEVRSRLDKGTVFVVRLPIVRSSRTTPVRAGAAAHR